MPNGSEFSMDRRTTSMGRPFAQYDCPLRYSWIKSTFSRSRSVLMVNPSLCHSCGQIMSREMGSAYPVPMKDIAREALDSALGHGVTYADVRVVESKERALTTKNGKPGHIASSDSVGLGVRVIVDGCWGFAATDDLSKAGIQKAA